MEQEQKYSVPLAIVAAGALIAGAIFFGGSNKSAQINNQEVKVSDVKVPAVTGEDHYLGTSDAELIIVEYSDTECPFCKMFHSTMKDVMAEYKGKVAWVYRHFPIVQLHARAPKEAEATECAAELGGNQAFWKYTDMIYENTQSNDTLDPAKLPQFASAVGLDVNAFNTCLSSGKYAEKIKESIEEAAKAGARGTPYSVIMNRKGEVQGVINGAEPLSNIKVKIDNLLD